MEESSIAGDESPARITAGAIIASAVLAALVAFFLRRALRSQENESIGDRLMADVTDADLRERAMSATGDFLRSHLAPEMRPMLLTMLQDVRDYVDKGFQRAEESIKGL